MRQHLDAIKSLEFSKNAELENVKQQYVGWSGGVWVVEVVGGGLDHANHGRTSYCHGP